WLDHHRGDRGVRRLRRDGLPHEPDQDPGLKAHGEGRKNRNRRKESQEEVDLPSGNTHPLRLAWRGGTCYTARLSSGQRCDMGEDSSIEWTTHTFNPWWGCVKVSEACRNCYAEAWARRTGLNVWGRTAARRFFGENHWREPRRWNELASRAVGRPRVFC